MAFTVYVPLTQRLLTPGWNVSLNEPFDIVSTLSANTRVPAGFVICSVTMYPSVPPVSVPETTPF